MGSVWLAEHLALKTQVVVKLIAAELSDNAEALGRFAREAAAASQVKSPHVVQMLDYGVMADGPPYIVMEWLEGHDLDQHLTAHGAMPPDQVAEVVTQIARALSRAHEHGIVHRDIKPSNIFLCDTGDERMFCKLLDFGIAKGLGDNNLLDSQTRTGAVVGSPHYMSPEQVVGSKTIDHRTDLWSLGVVAFEALTGHKPFDAETVGGLALKIYNEPLPLPSATARHLPAAVDAWFERACAREPSARFSSAKQLADALAVAVRGEGPLSLPVPSISSPRIGDLALAKTTVDASTGPDSMRALPPAKSLTNAGVTRGASRPARSRAWLAWAAGGLVLAVAGLGWLATRPHGPDANAAPIPTLASATTAPPTLSALAPLTPSVVPIGTPSAVPASAAVPSHTTVHHLAMPSTSAPSPAPSAATSPAPSAAASTTASPRPSATHDPYDIK